MAKKKTVAKKPATDAEMCLVSLEPVLAKALDKARGVTPKNPNGKTSRPAMAAELLAKALGIEGYQARKRGRPVTKTPTE